jgi:hypothetical protein
MFYLPNEQSKRIGAFIGAGSMVGFFAEQLGDRSAS